MTVQEMLNSLAHYDVRSEDFQVYDNKESTYDRFTIFGPTGCVGTSENPQGFYQHCEGTPGSHLGEKIKLEDLPTEVLEVYLKEVLEYLFDTRTI